MVIGMKAADHLFCIRTIPGGLEIVGLKAGVIFRKVKGEGGKGLSDRCTFPGADGRYQAGIQPAG